MLNAHAAPPAEAGQVQAFVPASESYREGALERFNAAVHPAPFEVGADALGPGQRITISIGQEIVNRTIDVVMGDKSCLWIWPDGGMGRRLIDLKVAGINSRIDQPRKPLGNELPLPD